MKKFSIAVVVIFLCSCAQRGINNEELSRRAALKETLNKEIYSYQNKDRERFFNFVSDEYYPNYKEFKYQIEDFLSANDNINLDLNVEKILFSGDKASVEINWDKTYVNKQGVSMKRNGSTVLFFDVSGKTPALKNIKGDNLFIQ